jgi:CheY-like chemotaxis protein
MRQERRLSVLVVDNDPFMREIFGLILTHHGVPHHCVADAPAALAYLKLNRVSVVIVDCSPPYGGRDDCALVQQIRAGDLAHGAKLVATSIYDSRPALSEQGFDGFILKPFDIGQVVPYLVRLVEKTTEVT